MLHAGPRPNATLDNHPMVHTRANTHTHTHTHTHTYTHTHTHTHTQIQTHIVWLCVCVCLCVCMLHAGPRPNATLDNHPMVHTYTHTHTLKPNTHTHTHTHRCPILDRMYLTNSGTRCSPSFTDFSCTWHFYSASPLKRAHANDFHDRCHYHHHCCHSHDHPAPLQSVRELTAASLKVVPTFKVSVSPNNWKHRQPEN
jgi:hypothetical protein